MSTYADRYRKVAGTFTQRVRAVPAAAWKNPAPPKGWVARDVVGHLTEWFPPFLRDGAAIELAAGPAVTEHPVAAWTVMSDSVQAVLDDAASTELTFDHPRAGQHLVTAAIDQFFTNDVFMHTWDLCRATGLDETLDADYAAELLAGMEPWDEILRTSGQYGPRVEVPADADAQTKLIAFIGRQP